MICSDNFEMYCMLHADGELSPAEIQELLAFLTANPHLEAEWNRWQQLKLTAPSIEFPEPEQLKQPGNAIISEAEAWLFIDGELSASEQFRIDSLLNTNAAARNRVQSLASLKLIPDFVACPDKASLYKKESIPRMIALRNVIRFAAAAMIGWLLYTYFPVLLTHPSTPADVVSQPRNIRQPADLSTADRQKKKAPAVFAHSLPIQSGNSSLIANNPNPALPQPEKILSNPASGTPQDISLPKPDPANAMLNNPTTPSATALENTTTQLPELTTEIKTPVQTVVYKEMDIESTRETISIGALEIREGKIRGIVRKAQAIFKTKNNSTAEPADEYKVVRAVQIIQN